MVLQPSKEGNEDRSTVETNWETKVPQCKNNKCILNSTKQSRCGWKWNRWHSGEQTYAINVNAEEKDQDQSNQMNHNRENKDVPTWELLSSVIQNTQ